MSSSSSSSGVKKLENFLIPLEEIIRATQNFSSKNYTGNHKRGKFYKAHLSDRWQNKTVEVKRHDSKSRQGKEEFLNELELLPSFDHKNIISFIGYCDQDDEMIVVTEYNINVNLRYHLKDQNLRSSLTWAKRLKICLGVAKGLEYLQSGLAERQGGRVIQREPQSGNILLDENMEAKLSNFESSIVIPRNQPHVYDASYSGTLFYTDPVYSESSVVNAKTDTYAFGMVLFEMVSGMTTGVELSFEDDGKPLVLKAVTYAYEMLSGMMASDKKSFEDGGEPRYLRNWIRRYSEVGFEKLIDPVIRDQIDHISLNMVKEVAYKCISLNLKERPTIGGISRRLTELCIFMYVCLFV